MFHDYLTEDEARFCLHVMSMSGSRIDVSEPAEGEQPVWQRPEERGLVKRTAPNYWAPMPALHDALLSGLLGHRQKAEVSCKTMRTSAGADHYVAIRVGDREVTPHMFREQFKTEYHVALYDWLLNGAGDEPDLMAFSEDDWPARRTDGLNLLSSRQDMEKQATSIEEDIQSIAAALDRPDLVEALSAIAHRVRTLLVRQS